MTDLTERLLTRLRELNTTDDHARGCQGREYHCSCDYDIRVENAIFEAITALETLTQEVERLRALLIDPCDPAWEDARSVLVAELRKMGFNGAAKQVGEGEGCNIPSWIALNLIAHSRKSLTQENARLREALEECICDGWYATKAEAQRECDWKNRP